jgi:hypothetical protein
MSRPDQKTIDILKHIATEIGAGKSFGRGHDEEIWNAAHDRALSIISSYRRGEGLFQLTEDMARK